MDLYLQELQPDKKPDCQRNYYLGLLVKLIPSFFTVGNGLLGFGSLIHTANENFFAASYCILLGALCDTLDGKCARMLDASHPIGIQLDSFSDLVSFCLAPAFLAYWWHLRSLRCLGFIVCAFFFLAGLLRLARFNVMYSEQKVHFLGLPSTAAGSLLVIALLHFSNTGLLMHQCRNLGLFIVFLGMLMISSFRFPRLTPMNALICYTSGVGIAIARGSSISLCLLGTALSYLAYALLLECVTKLPLKRYEDHSL